MTRPSLISDPAELPEAGPASEALALRVEALEFELELARRIEVRLQAEVQRLHHHIAAVDSDRSALRNRLDERERYLGAIHTSLGWKVLQWARALVGRRW